MLICVLFQVVILILKYGGSIRKLEVCQYVFSIYVCVLIVSPSVYKSYLFI